MATDSCKFRKPIQAQIEKCLEIGQLIAKNTDFKNAEEALRPRLATGDPNDEAAIQALMRSNARLALLGERGAKLEQELAQAKAQLISDALHDAAVIYAGLMEERSALVTQKVYQVEQLLEEFPTGAVHHFILQFESLVSGYSTKSDRLHQVSCVQNALNSAECADPVGVILNSFLPLL